MTEPLEGVGEADAPAGVPQGRCGTGVRQSPGLELGACQVPFPGRLQPSPSSPAGDLAPVGPTGTDRRMCQDPWTGRRLRGGSLGGEGRPGDGGWALQRAWGAAGRKRTHSPRGALDPRFLTCCPVRGPSLPLPTPGEPVSPRHLCPHRGSGCSQSLVSPPDPRLVGGWGSSSSPPQAQHAQALRGCGVRPPGRDMGSRAACMV